MDATSVYPNAVPVLAATGLGVTLSGNDPDHVPLMPDFINDSRRRFAPDSSAVDVSGVIQLHVRNALGYSFLRPHQRNKLQMNLVGNSNVKKAEWNTQASFYRNNYRHFVPHDLMMDYLKNECPPQDDCFNLSKWQGNAIAGVNCGQDGHVVFYPTGHVLQQACAWYSKGESAKNFSCSSTKIETGAPIRQFSVMGCRDAYHSTSAAKVYAAARGNTFCTIIAAPARVTRENLRKLQAKAKISLRGVMINHVTGSPHVDAELAITSGDGTVHCWDPEGGVQIVKEDSYTPNRILRCEYSCHPRVLWAANRVTVSILDLRQPLQHENTLFDVASAGSFASVYDIKRRSSNPFQFVVGTSVAIELTDSRMPRQPLISWIQPQNYSGEQDFSFGAVDDVNLSRNGQDSRGYIVSTLKRHKVTTLFPYERNRKRKGTKVMSLMPLRSNGDDAEYSELPQTNIEQFVASEATLDLRMDDGGEYTHLTGLCALCDETLESASIYQLNSLGDLFSHRVSVSRSQIKSYHSAIQPELPSGIAATDNLMDESASRFLPIPVDAILPEHDTESLQRFITLPVKALRRQFPRLSDNKEAPNTEDDRSYNVTHALDAIAFVNLQIKDSRTSQAKQNKIRLNGASNKLKRGVATKSLAIRRIRSKPSHERHESTDTNIRAKIPREPLSERFDKNELARRLLSVCDPSTSLFRLHRFVIEMLRIEMSSSKLLLYLRSRSEFRIRTICHSLPIDRFWVHDPSNPGADNVHIEKDDPRVVSCVCYPGSVSAPLPCESWSCVLPHAIIVSIAVRKIHLDDTAPSSAVKQDMAQELADIIFAAQAVYDDMPSSK